jgi:hypothetical protein
MPALPLHEAGKYVAAAYIVFTVLILVYVAIMAVKLARVERDLGQLLQLTDPAGGAQPDDPAQPDPAQPADTRPAGEPTSHDASSKEAVAVP